MQYQRQDKDAEIERTKLSSIWYGECEDKTLKIEIA